MKLFDKFEVVSNKTVRKKEKFFKKYYGHKSVPGQLIKTNRGFFMAVFHKATKETPAYTTTHEIDQKSAELWFDLVKSAKKNNSKN